MSELPNEDPPNVTELHSNIDGLFGIALVDLSGKIIGKADALSPNTAYVAKVQISLLRPDSAYLGRQVSVQLHAGSKRGVRLHTVTQNIQLASPSDPLHPINGKAEFSFEVKNSDKEQNPLIFTFTFLHGFEVLTRATIVRAVRE